MENKNDDFLQLATEFLKAVTGEFDPYTSQNGEIVQENANSVSLLTPSHIQYAKYGRAPGKRPPLDPIEAWVKREGIIFDGLDERGTAFAIQASIAKNGTKNWQPDAPNALEEAIQGHLEEYNTALAKSLSVTVSDEVNEIYKTITPSNRITM